MSLAVSEFAVPCTVFSAEQVKTLGRPDKQRIALGTPLIIGDRCYRFKWDRQYTAPHLLSLPNQNSPAQRDRREEKALTASLQGQLRDGLVSEVEIERLHPNDAVSRNAALEHVAAGGLLQVNGRACPKRFTVVVDRRGKAAWTTVSESRWPALKALWNWLRCLGSQGRREWRDERQLLRELGGVLPPDEIKARRESIEVNRSELAGGLDKQNPSDVQRIFRERIATPEAVVQFLRFDGNALERSDNDARTVLHHVARDPRLATGTVLDSLFMKLDIDAIARRNGQAASERARAAAGEEATPRLFVSDYDGNTPVHLAVLHGDKAAVQRFLQQAARTDAENAQSAGLPFTERRNLAGQTIWDCAQERMAKRAEDSWLRDIVSQYCGQPPAVREESKEAERPAGMPACSRTRLAPSAASPGRHGRH